MILGDEAAAVGKGIFAGFAGVAAMTLSQEIEIKLSGCVPSTGPSYMVPDLLGVEPKTEEKGDLLELHPLDVGHKSMVVVD